MVEVLAEVLLVVVGVGEVTEKEFLMTKAKTNFLNFLVAPAQRALIGELGITKLQDLSRFTKKDLLSLHGFRRQNR